MNHKENSDFYKQGYEDAKRHFIENDCDGIKSKWFSIGYKAGVLEASETITANQDMPSKPLDDCCFQAFCQARVYVRIALCGINLHDAAIYSKFIASEYQEREQK
jgi:hypothetical protein